jgi:hypothetical protein
MLQLKTRLYIVYYVTWHTSFIKAFFNFKMSYHFMVYKFRFIFAYVKSAAFHVPVFMKVTSAE